MSAAEPISAAHRRVDALAKQSHAPQAIGDSYVMRALGLGRLDATIGHLRGMRQGGAGVPVHRVRRCECEADHTTDARRIAPFVLNQFDALIRGDWSVLDAAPVERVVQELVEDWGEYYLERPIRSLRLIDS